MLTIDRMSELLLDQVDQGEQIRAGAERQVDRVGVADPSPERIRDRRGHGVDEGEVATLCSVAVDPQRIIVGGFSDGATYAISLGLQNGDLFRRVLAFSPGFYVGDAPQGKPRVFVSHGTRDEVLPIDRCSRIIVPRLQKGGYDVTFREFEGGHEIPPDIARAGMRWSIGR